MQLHVWRSFSSNNSSDCRVVARFESAAQARAVYKELKVFLPRHAKQLDALEEWDEPSAAQRALAKKHGFAWTEILDWGDGGLLGDEPDLALAENTLALYHNYCCGLEIDSYLEAAGAKKVEVDEGEPTIAAIVSLPAGAKKLRSDLQKFFGQAEGGKSLDRWKAPPWHTGRWSLPDTPADEVAWFCDGDSAAFCLPMRPRDIEGLQGYLNKHKAKVQRMSIGDVSLGARLRALSAAQRCPECKGNELKLVLADGKKLSEEQLLCGGCGGMFTIAALTAAAPVTQLGEAKLTRVCGDDEVVFICGCGIYRSKKGGGFSHVRKNGSYLGLCVAAEVILAAGAGGRLMRSTNGGTRWSQVQSGVTGDLFNFTAKPDGTLFVAGRGGVILRSEDDGETWSKTKLSVKGDVFDVEAVDDKQLFAVGGKGVGLLRSRDGGNSWQKQRIDAKTPLCQIRALSDKQLVVVGDSGVILTSDDGGERWTKRPSKTKADIEDITVGNDGRLYAVTSSGQILISANRGKIWKVEPSGTKKHLWGIGATPSGTLILVGEDGVVARRDDLDTPRAEAPKGTKKTTKKL